MKKQAYENMLQQRKEKKAIALIQSFIRRRNFRRVVDAIVYQIRVKKGLVTPKNLKKSPQNKMI